MLGVNWSGHHLRGREGKRGCRGQVIMPCYRVFLQMGDKPIEDDDAPLDFSIKRPSPTESPEDREERPGVLRSPELGQTAVPSLEPITIQPEEKLDEPHPGIPGSTVPTTALPAYPPGSLLPHLAAMQQMISGSPVPILASDAKLKQQQPNCGKGGMRPFKAYPKEPLSLPIGYFGLPGMNPFPTMDATNGQANQEEVYKQYREYVLKLQEQQQKASGGLPSGGVPLDKSPPLQRDAYTKLPSSPTNVSSTSSSNGGSIPTSPAGSMVPASSPSSNSTVSTTTGGGTTGGSSGNKRKRTSSLPDEQKDQAYWERRRKNNDAAKRSRDARRAKEDEIAIRAAFLEQENLKLRVEVASLKNETAKLRCMLYNS
jgi:bZIP factor